MLYDFRTTNPHTREAFVLGGDGSGFLEKVGQPYPYTGMPLGGYGDAGMYAEYPPQQYAPPGGIHWGAALGGLAAGGALVGGGYGLYRHFNGAEAGAPAAGTAPTTAPTTTAPTPEAPTSTPPRTNPNSTATPSGPVHGPSYVEAPTRPLTRQQRKEQRALRKYEQRTAEMEHRAQEISRRRAQQAQRAAWERQWWEQNQKEWAKAGKRREIARGLPGGSFGRRFFNPKNLLRRAL